MNRTISLWLAATLILVAGAGIERAQADDLEALGKAVAEALGYPAERLTVSDMTASPKAKASGGTLAGILLEANDGTFAPMTLGISKRGSILTAELEVACEEALDGGDPDESAPLARVAFASGEPGEEKGSVRPVVRASAEGALAERGLGQGRSSTADECFPAGFVATAHAAFRLVPAMPRQRDETVIAVYLGSHP